MVLFLRNGQLDSQRTLSIQPFQPPASLDYHAAAQRAAQQRYCHTALPAVEVPAAQTGTSCCTLWEQGASAMHIELSWSHLTSCLPLKQLANLAPLPADLVLEPQRLPPSVQQPPGPPGPLLQCFRTPTINDWVANNGRGGGLLEVPIAASLSSKAEEKEPSLHKAILLLECFAQAQNIPDLPTGIGKVPDITPQLLEVQPGAESQPWSLIGDIARQAQDSESDTKPGLMLEVPLLLSTNSDNTATAGTGTSMLPGLQDWLPGMLEQAAAKLTALEQQGEPPVTKLAELQGPSCLAALDVMPAAIDPLHCPQQAGLPAFLEAACSGLPMGTARKVASLPTLEVPMLLPDDACSGSAAGSLPACLPAELFQPLPEPPGASWIGVSISKAVSISALVARDLVLDGGPFMLPAVIVETEDGSCADSGFHSGSLTQGLVQGCGLRPSNSAHAALYMDWSLTSTASAMRPQVLTTKHLEQASWPQQLPKDAQPVPGAAVSVLPSLLASYKGHQAVYGGLPPSKLDIGPSTASRLPPVAPTLPTIAPHAGACIKRAGALAAPAPSHKAGKAPKQAPPAKNDLHYFLQLQQDNKAAPPVAHDTQTSDSSAGNIEEFLHTASRSVMQVALPDSHMQLLRFLREDERRLVAATPGLSAAVARSDFLSLEILQAQLQAAALGQAKEVLKAYAAMAVIRQTALTLVHHGVRTAHLYYSQSATELPGLLAGVTAARDLHQAYNRVDANQQEDHPKQDCLRRTLQGIQAMSPGSKVLVVADSKSFFTLYPAIQAAGLRTCQLDRLLQAKTGAQSANTAEVLQAALKDTSCLLVSVQQASSQRIPPHHFQHVVVYASEPEALMHLEPFLSSCQCPQQVMQVTVGSLSEPQESVPLQSAPLLQQHRPQQAPQHRQLGGSIEAPAAGPLATGMPPACDWPLVISSDPSRPVRQQRALYEALLQLERSGASVVERPLALIDAVLSPSVALMVHDNTADNMEFDQLLERLQPSLERLSYAFAKVILICQGSVAFQAQVLCGIGQLLALGQAYGLRVQCFTSTSVAATEGLVRGTVSTFLTRWAAQDAKLHYAVSDTPTPLEKFLSRFPSLNPHSAALLASLGASLEELLHLDLSAAASLPPALALVPKHSLELFTKCAAYGRPVPRLGVTTALREAEGHCHQGVQAGAHASIQPQHSEPSEEDGYFSPHGYGANHQQFALGDPCLQRQEQQHLPAKRQRLAAAAGPDVEVPHAAVEAALVGQHACHGATSLPDSQYFKSRGQLQSQMPTGRQAMQCADQDNLPHGYRGSSLALLGASEPWRQNEQLAAQHHMQQPRLPLQPSHRAAAGSLDVYPHNGLLRLPNERAPMQHWQQAQEQEQEQAQLHQQHDLYRGTDSLQYHHQAPPIQSGRPAGLPVLQQSRHQLGHQQSRPRQGACMMDDLSSQLNRPPAVMAGRQSSSYEPPWALTDTVYQQTMQLMQSRIGGASHVVGYQQPLAQQDGGGLPELPELDACLQNFDTGPYPSAGQPRLGAPAAQARHLDRGPVAGNTGFDLGRWGQQAVARAPGRQHRQPSSLHSQQPLQLGQQDGAFSTPYGLHSQHQTLQQAWQPGGQQLPGQQHGGRLDEFGVSLEPSLSDEESDHDATMSARLSPLGIMQHPAAMGAASQQQLDPIAALVGSRGGFSYPRLTPGSAQRAGAAPSPASRFHEEEQDGQPPNKRRKPAFAAFTQQPAQPQKKYGRGYGGYKRGAAGKGTKGAARKGNFWGNRK